MTQRNGTNGTKRDMSRSVPGHSRGLTAGQGSGTCPRTRPDLSRPPAVLKTVCGEGMGSVDLLTPDTPEQIQARAERLWCRALAAQARILIDGYAYAARMAQERGQACPDADAIVRKGVAYERALMRRAGAPDVDYEPAPSLRRHLPDEVAA